VQALEARVKTAAATRWSHPLITSLRQLRHRDADRLAFAFADRERSRTLEFADFAVTV